MKTAKLLSVIFISCSFIALSANAQHHYEAPNYTTRVYPGVDGKLVYSPDEQGGVIPDFSHAGYVGGGIALPYVPGDGVSPIVSRGSSRLSSGAPPTKGAIRSC